MPTTSPKLTTAAQIVAALAALDPEGSRFTSDLSAVFGAARALQARKAAEREADAAYAATAKEAA
jgi:hypothetical protein